MSAFLYFIRKFKVNLEYWVYVTSSICSLEKVEFKKQINELLNPEVGSLLKLLIELSIGVDELTSVADRSENDFSRGWSLFL